MTKTKKSQSPDSDGSHEVSPPSKDQEIHGYKKLMEETKGHVVAEILPKLKDMESRLKNQITAEITDVKGMIETIATGQHKATEKPVTVVGPEGQTKNSPNLDSMMKDPEIAQWVNQFKQMGNQIDQSMDPSKNPIYGLGQIPKNMQNPEAMQQMNMMQGGPMGQLTQFIQMMKMLEGGGGMFGGGNQMMQEIMYRQYLNTMLQSNQQGLAATKFFMRMASMGPEKIAEFEKLSNDLMGPIKDGIETAAAKTAAEKAAKQTG